MGPVCADLPIPFFDTNVSGGYETEGLSKLSSLKPDNPKRNLEASSCCNPRQRFITRISNCFKMWGILKRKRMRRWWALRLEKMVLRKWSCNNNGGEVRAEAIDCWP